jgi:superoxide dismutase, Cu-Zn family
MKSYLLPYAIALSLFLTGCGQKKEETGIPDGSETAAEEASLQAETAAMSEEGGQEQSAAAAIAKIQPTQGSKVQGVVTFTQETEGIRVSGHITGLTPGDHGFHIHEHGDCSAPDASSAGGHFNPTGAKHGGPETEESHLGDLGNITANEAGEAHIDKLDPRLSLEGEHTIIGKSVIVHANADDFHTQPSGGAGDRVGCGVISQEAQTE